MAENETQEKGNDGLPVEIKRLVKPDFMGEPDVMGFSRELEHEYKLPTKGEEVVEAIIWMLSVYDDVRIEDNIDSRALLVGDVREV